VKAKRKSSGYFYLCLADAVIIAMLALSVALVNRYLPLSFNGCWGRLSDLASTQLFFHVKQATGDSDKVISCQRILMVQITTIMTMYCVSFLQDGS
jgi:hypothetical protein